MNKAIITIGMPGSGKSTVARVFAEKHGYKYLDFDEVKKDVLKPEELTEANTRIDTAPVWEQIKTKASEYAKEKKTVVIDASFANVEFRKAFLDFLREQGFRRISGMYVNVSLETAQNRAENRKERPLCKDVILKYHELLREPEPSIKEGMDSLFIIDEQGELVNVHAFDRGGQEISKKIKIS